MTAAPTLSSISFNPERIALSSSSVFFALELEPVGLSLLPHGGEFRGMAVRGVRPPLGEAFLAAARVSFGEPHRYIFGLDRLACPRRRPRRGSERNRLSLPGRAPRSLLGLRFPGPPGRQALKRPDAARRSARSAGFEGETANSRFAAAPFLPARGRDDRDSRRSKAVSSVRSLTNPLFENRGGVVLIELDEFLQLALRAVVAPRQQRLQKRVAA